MIGRKGLDGWSCFRTYVLYGETNLYFNKYEDFTKS